jgi:hypothetical protein
LLQHHTLHQTCLHGFDQFGVDPIEAALGPVAEETLGLAWPHSDPPVLLIEQLIGQRFQEVFVSPEISPATTPREQLLAVVSTARVGLHLVRQVPH